MDDALRAKLNETELHDLHTIAGGRAASPKPSNDAPATSPGYIDAPTAMQIIGQLKALPRAEVDALGGRIETTSTWGKGTQFKLVVPLTTAVTQVVMLR